MKKYIGITILGDPFGPLDFNLRIPNNLAGSPVVIRYEENSPEQDWCIGEFNPDIDDLGWTAAFEMHRRYNEVTSSDRAVFKLLLNLSNQTFKGERNV